MTKHIEKLPIDTTFSHQISTASINLLGLNVSLTLTRDNFFLWRTHIFPVLAAYELMDRIEQDPLEISNLNKDGRTSMNPTYKTWFKIDKVVLATINSSLTESHVDCGCQRNCKGR